MLRHRIKGLAAFNYPANPARAGARGSSRRSCPSAKLCWPHDARLQLSQRCSCRAAHQPLHHQRPNCTAHQCQGSCSSWLQGWAPSARHAVQSMCGALRWAGESWRTTCSLRQRYKVGADCRELSHSCSRPQLARATRTQQALLAGCLSHTVTCKPYLLFCRERSPGGDKTVSGAGHACEVRCGRRSGSVGAGGQCKEVPRLPKQRRPSVGSAAAAGAHRLAGFRTRAGSLSRAVTRRALCRAPLVPPNFPGMRLSEALSVNILQFSAVDRGCKHAVALFAGLPCLLGPPGRGFPFRGGGWSTAGSEGKPGPASLA